jgi:hypothetical protein
MAAQGPRPSRDVPRTTSISPAPADWNTLTADITVRRARLDRAGRRVGPDTEPVRYVLERRREAGGWATRMRMPRHDRTLLTVAGDVPAAPPRAVVLAETRADGEAPRLLDAAGRDVALPRLAWPRTMERDSGAPDVGLLLNGARRAGGARTSRASSEWADVFLTVAADHAQRRAALAREHGPARGRVRGLDRFVSERGGRRREVLVEPGLALPVEVNDVEGGQLVAHRTFAYEAGPTGAMVRRGTHAEHLAGDGTGERLVVDVDLSNLRFERRR